MKLAVTIGGKHIKVHIRRDYKPCMCHAYNKVVLSSTSMCRHGHETRITERLSTSHMLIVIEKTQSTFAAIPSAVMIEGGVVN
jgi:hypothetical protein